MKKFLLATAMIVTLGSQAFATFTMDNFKKDATDNGDKKDAYAWVKWAGAKSVTTADWLKDGTFKNALVDLLARAGTSKKINSAAKVKNDQGYVSDLVEELMKLISQYAAEEYKEKTKDEADKAIEDFIAEVKTKRDNNKKAIYHYKDDGTMDSELKDNALTAALAKHDAILFQVMRSGLAVYVDPIVNNAKLDDLKSFQSGKEFGNDLGSNDKEKLAHYKGILKTVNPNGYEKLEKNEKNVKSKKKIEAKKQLVAHQKSLTDLRDLFEGLKKAYPDKVEDLEDRIKALETKRLTLKEEDAKTINDIDIEIKMIKQIADNEKAEEEERLKAEEEARLKKETEDKDAAEAKLKKLETDMNQAINGLANADKDKAGFITGKANKKKKDTLESFIKNTLVKEVEDYQGTKATGTAGSFQLSPKQIATFYKLAKEHNDTDVQKIMQENGLDENAQAAIDAYYKASNDHIDATIAGTIAK